MRTRGNACAAVYIGEASRKRERMSGPTTPADLLDLKLMPAWVNEPAQATDYSNYEGED
jgi:hypothetical protein